MSMWDTLECVTFPASTAPQRSVSVSTRTLSTKINAFPTVLSRFYPRLLNRFAIYKACVEFEHDSNQKAGWQKEKEVECVSCNKTFKSWATTQTAYAC